jgi:hypothetical protein
MIYTKNEEVIKNTVAIQSTTIADLADDTTVNQIKKGSSLLLNQMAKLPFQVLESQEMLVKS